MMWAWDHLAMAQPTNWSVGGSDSEGEPDDQSEEPDAGLVDMDAAYQAPVCTCCVCQVRSDTEPWFQEQTAVDPTGNHVVAPVFDWCWGCGTSSGVWPLESKD